MSMSNLKIITLFCVALCLVACADPLPPAPIVDGWQQRSSASVYRVQPDDTIYSIAWMFGMDYRDIARYNHLSEPYAVREGQALNLTPPANTSKAVTYPVATTYPVETPPVDTFSTTTPAPQSGRTLYTPSSSSLSESSASMQPASKEKSAASSSTASAKPPVGGPTGGPKGGKWLWPVKGEVVKGFSTASGGNRGIDISAKYQEPVVASASGKVVYTGSSMPGYGQLIIVKHDNNNLSAYAFNHSILVKEGEAVKAGQQIAAVGKNSEGKPMLHFEVRSHGKPQDPLAYLK